MYLKFCNFAPQGRISQPTAYRGYSPPKTLIPQASPSQEESTVAQSNMRAAFRNLPTRSSLITPVKTLSRPSQTRHFSLLVPQTDRTWKADELKDIYKYPRNPSGCCLVGSWTLDEVIFWVIFSCLSEKLRQAPQQEEVGKEYHILRDLPLVSPRLMMTYLFFVLFSWK